MDVITGCNINVWMMRFQSTRPRRGAIGVFSDLMNSIK